MKLKLTHTFILLFSIMCSGCIMTSSYPVSNKYMLNVKTSKKIAPIPLKQNLFVHSTTIIPQFANVNFVYRTSKINYLTDYYNEFFTLPANLINQAITKYLSATNVFRFVTNGPHPITANYLLTSKVIELYADYRNRHHPKAVMAAQFNLFFTNQSGEKIMLLNKTFAAAAPLRCKDSKSLVNAWNVDMEIILRRLAYSLRRIH